MGFLTTLTIYNDACDKLKDEKDLGEKLYQACVYGKESTLSLGNHCNAINVQKPRHADDHTIYIHRGNCVTSFNAYEKETQNLCTQNTEFYDKMLNQLEQSVKELKELKRKLRK